MRRRWLLAFLLLVTLGCGVGAPEPELDGSPRVTRMDGDRLAIAWDAGWSRSEVRVFANLEPDPAVRGEPVAATAQPPLVFADPNPGERSYFLLVRARGAMRLVAERRIPLEGAANFRDLGGYQTKDGRQVRWGQVFRADALSELSDDDVATLARLGIRLVCDLRSPEERAAAPDRLPEPAPEVLHLPIHDAQLESAELQERLLAGDLETEESARILIDGNVAFATTFRDRYAALFRRLLAPDAFPTLVHCTAGKDRAGFAAALLLLVLGVPEETVMDDYLATNRFTAAKTTRSLRLLRIFSWFRTTPEEARPLLEARREYLQAGLDALDAAFGSRERYWSAGLGLKEPEIEELRSRLLFTPAH